MPETKSVSFFPSPLSGFVRSGRYFFELDMKVLAVLVCLVASAMCSLEPANYRAPSSHYLPSNQYNRVSSTYRAPSNQYIPAPSDSFTPPEVVNARSSFPSTSYGVPDYNGARANHQHGYSNHHNHHDHHQEEHHEPAKYNFGYIVKDNYGNDYGHKESRDGSKTRGSYSVLLPDGRRQIVEYEADEAGYRPKISYELARPNNFGQTDNRAAYPGAPY